MRKKLRKILSEFTNNTGKNYPVKKYPEIIVEIFDETINKIEELYREKK